MRQESGQLNMHECVGWQRKIDSLFVSGRNTRNIMPQDNSFFNMKRHVHQSSGDCHLLKKRTFKDCLFDYETE